MSFSTLTRRAVSAVAAAMLLGGLLPTVASADTPEKRDIAEFACPPSEVPDPGFSDDDDTTVEHRASIACIVWYGLASGRTRTTYAPKLEVNRGQMATFIANLLARGGVALPDDPPDAFDDDDDTEHEQRINQLAALGVVDGFEDGEYKHWLAVSRAQMATYLANAYAQVTDDTLSSSEDYFTDDDGTFHEDNINAVAGAGIAAGRTADTYAPGGAVKRDQMATFLARETDLLVEEGEVTKPVVTPADVRLASSSVSQGGKVRGTIATQDDVEVAGASVSGCGITEQTLTLSGDTNAFEFTISVTQPTGACELTFTIDREDGDAVTDEETITVTAGTSQTSAPELTKVQKGAESGDDVTLTYTFDERLKTQTLRASDFRVYDASANRTDATAASVSGSTVNATFPKSAVANATTATVMANAVEDEQAVSNPEGAAPMAQRSTQVDGTSAPDLVDIVRAGNEGYFEFDETIVAHPGTASDYHLVLDDGTVVDGSTITYPTGDDVVHVTFPAVDADREVVRGYVETDTVAGSEQDPGPLAGVEDGNPTHAEPIEGGGDTPYLVSATIDATNNQVIYRFDRSVTLISKDAFDAPVFIAYDLEGNEVGTNEATASASTVTATFSGTSDPITGATVGASVRADAVRAATGTRLPNEVDEILVKSKTTVSGAQGGETSAPDLRSVTRSIDGNDTVITYTFDQPVAQGTTLNSTSGALAIYQRDGTRTVLDLNGSSGNECSTSGSTVVCRAVSTSPTGQLMDSAVLGGVEHDTVSSTASSDPARNYEASAPIS